MKKFASIFISLLLVAMMVCGTVVSAASVLQESTGTLTLLKKEPAVDPETGVQKPVSGAEFTAYQVMDLADGTYKPTTNFASVSGVDALVSAYELNAGEGGIAYTDTAAFESLIPALETQSKSATTANGAIYNSTESATDAGEYTFGDMAIGVYLVVETKVPKNYTAVSKTFLVSIPEWDNDTKTWNYDITASPKNAPVSLNKVIVEGTDEVSETTKNIGDTVDYKVTSVIPNYGLAADDTTITSLTFTMTDTMSQGLTFNEDMVVKAGTATLTSADYDYSFNNTTNVITVSLKTAIIKANQGKDFTATYSATLNSNAAIGSANTNTVHLDYTNDPKVADSIDSPDDVTTKVYTFEMDLTKTFNNKSAAAASVDASSVEFSLSQNGTKLTFTETASGVYVADAAASTTALNPSSTGSLVVKGLDVGTYVLAEEASAKDYSKLANTVEIVVTAEKDGTNKYTGNVLAKADTKINATSTGKSLDTEGGVFKLTVNNVSKQFNLPVTGGMGLWIFTIAGGVIMGAAIIVFLTNRRKKVSE